MTTTIYYFGTDEHTTKTIGTNIALLRQYAMAQGPFDRKGFLDNVLFALNPALFFMKKLYNQYEVMAAKERVAELIQTIKNTNANFVAEQLGETKKYTFEPGHIVKDGSFYISDLLYPDVLIPLVDYQDRVYKEKMITLKRLLGTLGAKSFQVTKINYSEHQFEGGARVPVQQLAGNVGVDVDFNHETKETNSHKRTYGIPPFKPFIPPEIVKWVKYNQDFRGFCDSRLESNGLTDSVNIELSEKIGAGVTISVKAASIDTSGTLGFKSHCSSTWTFNVEFYSHEELAHLPIHPSQQ